MTSRKNLYRSIILVTVVVLFFAPVSSGNLWWREAINCGHTIFFIFLSVAIYNLVKARVFNTNILIVYLYVLVIGFLFGSAIEILQGFVQRDPSWDDLYGNFLGIMTGLCLLAVVTLQDIKYRKMVVVLLVAGSVGFLSVGMAPLVRLSWHYVERINAFPVIVNFDSEWSGSFVRHNKGRYPGVSVFEPEPDWSAYRSLRFSIYSTNKANMSLGLRVHDENHNNESSDRFNMKLPIRSGVNEFKIPLDVIRDAPLDRELDLKSIAGIILYSRKSDEWMQVDVSNFYLE